MNAFHAGLKTIIILMLALGLLPAHSQVSRLPLATSVIKVQGNRLETISKMDVLGGEPFVVPVKVQIGSKTLSPDELNAQYPGGKFQGILTGNGPEQPIEGAFTDGGLKAPALSGTTIFNASSIKLVKPGQGGWVTALDTPQVVEIKCLGDVVISKMEVKPMTLDEISKAGIQLNASNYETSRFTMALSIGGKDVSLSVPVATPVYNGLESPNGGSIFGKLDIKGLENVGGVDLHVAVADIMPVKDPFMLSRPALSHAIRNNFKALLVIPGTITYLHQFYQAKVVIFNALPPGSPSADLPYKITNLTAAYAPSNPLNDPLRLVMRPGDTNPQKVLKMTRKGEDPNALKGGESGAASFCLEALKEGNHPLEIKFQGQFEGGNLLNPVAIQGKAVGKVLVRNPTFSLMLVHPDVVAKGETYTLEARLTNTSETTVYKVSLGLDAQRLGSVQMTELDKFPQSQMKESIEPGKSASYFYRLKSLKTGEIYSSYLYMEKGTIGFELSTGVGERQIKLSSDTLRLPDSLKNKKEFPEGLKESMLKVLSQAYSIATKKPQPAGVLPIPVNLVTGDFSTLFSQEGLFLKMGVDKARIWWDLWKQFNQNADPGFDQLMRQTVAGAELRNAFLAAWPWADPNHGIQERLKDFGAFGEGIGPWRLLGIQGVLPGLSVDWQPVRKKNRDVSSVFGQGNGMRLVQLAEPSAQGTGNTIRLRNDGLDSQVLQLTTLNRVTGEASPVFHGRALTLFKGDVAILELGQKLITGRLISANGTQTPLESIDGQLVASEPFKVLGVHRYDLDLVPDATPFGTHVMALFNRPLMSLDYLTKDDADNNFYKVFDFDKAESLVSVPGNRLLRKVMGTKLDKNGYPILDPATGQAKIQLPPPAMFKAMPQILSVYLEKPVGPNVNAELTLQSGWKDSAGRALEGQLTWPIQCGAIPGGAKVWGKVRKVDGTGVESDITYWYYSKVRGGEVDLLTNMTFAEEFIDFYYAQVSNFRTDKDGNYQLDYVPEPVSYAIGPMMLQAKTLDGSGTAFALASVTGNGQNIQMDLVLEGKGSVEGTVTDANGNPLDGVTVQVTQEQPSPGMTAGTGGGVFQAQDVTKNGGQYSIKNLKTGVFSLRALKGLYGVALSGEIARDGQVVRKDFVLTGKTGTVKMRIVDVNNNPVLDQAIRLGFPAGLIRTASLDMKYVYPTEALPNPAEGTGWVTFTNVPAGDIHCYAPYVVKGKVQEFRGQFNPSPDNNFILEYTLRTLDPLSLGKVKVFVYKKLNGVEVPIPKAFVSLGRSDNFEALTGENGETPILNVEAGRVLTCWAYHQDWPSKVQGTSLEIQPGGPYNLRVEMPYQTGIKGVVKRDGVPVAGAHVAVPPVYDDDYKNRRARTNEKGEFTISKLALTSAPMRLAVVGPELRTATNLDFTVSEGIKDLGDIQLPKDCNNVLKGTVYQPEESGNPPIPTIANLTVMGYLPDITATREGNPNWGKLKKYVTGIKSGTGVDPNSSENYVIDKLPAGPFSISASSAFYPAIAAEGTFDTCNQTLPLNLTFVANFAGELSGRIVARDGQTPAPVGTRVRLLGGTVGELTVRVELGPNGEDPKGKYQFPKVIPAGTYRMRVEDPQSGDIAAIDRIDFGKEASQVRNFRLWGKGNLKIHAQNSQGNPMGECDIAFAHSKDQPGLVEPGDLPEKKAIKLKLEDQGEALIENLLEGAVSLTLRDPAGYIGRASVEIPVGGGDAEVTVRLQPVGKIHGLVKRADGTNVVAGRVDAYGQRGDQQDAWLGVIPVNNGEFTLQELPAGMVRLEVWDPDSRQVGRTNVLVKENQTSEVTITCLDKGKVNVLVLADGQPATRVGLSVQYQNGPALHFSTEATTASSDIVEDGQVVTPKGGASFWLPPGDYQVSATHPETLSTASLTFSRANNEGLIEKTMALNPVRTLSVTMLPPKGAEDMNLSGWKLTASKIQRSVMLDTAGQGTLDLPSGNYELTLTDPYGRYRGHFQVNVLQEPAVQPKTLQAFARGSVIVQVLNAGNQGVSGITAYPSGVKYWGGLSSTDQAGKAIFANVMEGSGTMIVDGCASQTFAIQAENDVLTLNFRTAPTGSVRGRITFPDGVTPVPYSLVNVNWVKTATDKDGYYRVDRLPLNMQLRVSVTTAEGRSGISDPFVLTESTDLPSDSNKAKEINVQLLSLGRILGKLTDPLRPSPRPMNVKLYGAGVNTSTVTDPQGNFLFAAVPAGVSLTLDVYMDDNQALALKKTLLIPGEGVDFPVNETIEKLVDVLGTTRDQAGVKIPMKVKLKGGPEVVTTEDHPTYIFHYLKSGVTYTLFGYKPLTSIQIAGQCFTLSGNSASETVDLAAKATGKVQGKALKGLDVMPDQIIAVTYTGPDTDPNLRPLTGVTGADGLALIEDVMVGPVKVWASLEGKYAESIGEVRAGETLQAELRGQDMTWIEGTVKRAGNANQWPAGTLLKVQDQSFTVNPDGSIVPNGKMFPSSGQTIIPSVQLAAGAAFTLPAFQAAKNAATVLNLTAPAFGAVKGVVYDSKHVLLQGGTVKIHGLITSTFNGAYRVEGIPANASQTYSLEAFAAPPSMECNRLDSIRVEADGQEVSIADISLRGTGTLKVYTRNRAGEPVSGVAVTVSSRENVSTFNYTVTLNSAQKADGVYAEFINLLSGNAQAKATIEGAWLTEDLTVNAGGTASVTLQPKPITAITGQVKRSNPSVKWPAGTRISIGGKSLSLDEDGRIQVQGGNNVINFGSGTAFLSLYLPGRSSASTSAEVTLTLNETVIDFTAPPLGSITGVLKDGSGNLYGNRPINWHGDEWVYTNAQGSYVIQGLPLGAYHLTATVNEMVADGSQEIKADGDALTCDLVLSDSKVYLPVYMQRGRGADSVVINSYYAREFNQFASIEGGSRIYIQPTNNMAKWIEKNRILTLTRQEGDLLFTVTRTVAPDSLLLRDETSVKNMGTVPHKVQLIQTTDTYSPALIYPNNDNAQAPIGFFDPTIGCLLWGDGTAESIKPTVSSSGQGELQWPEWTLEAGQSAGIAVAHAPYNSYEQNGWRKEGAMAQWQRIRRQAPEWLYGGEPATWRNWGPFLSETVQALPTWNATFRANVVDAAGEVPVNSLSWEFLPKEILAKKVYAYSTGSTYPGQPADGGKFKVTLPGSSTPVERDLASTDVSEIRLEEAASLSFWTTASDGTTPRQSSLTFSPNGASSFSKTTNVEGKLKPILVAPGTLNVSASLNSASEVSTSLSGLSTSAGINPEIQLSFPALGRAELKLYVGGSLYNKNCGGYLYNQAIGTSHYTSSANGVLTWTDLLPGQWVLDMSNPETGGRMPALVFNVAVGDTPASQSYNLVWASVKVTVQNQAGNNVNAAYVVCYGSDGGSRSAYTDGNGVCIINQIATGNAEVRVTDNTSGLTVRATVPDLQAGQQAEVTLKYLKYAQLNITTKTLDQVLIGQTLNYDNQWISNYNGTVSIPHVPVGTHTIQGYYNDTWSPAIPVQTITVNDSDHNTSIPLALTVPVGTVTFQVKRAGEVKPGAVLSFISPWGYNGGSKTTDAEGKATFSNVPVNLEITLAADFENRRETFKFTLRQTGQLEPIALSVPRKVTVHLKRLNAGTLAADGWRWTADPPSPSGQNPVNTLDPIWEDLPSGQAVTITATKILYSEGSRCGEWKGSTVITPGETPLEQDLMLPALAKVKFQFKDGNGQVLTGNMSSNWVYAWLRSDSTPNNGWYFRVISAFDQASWDEVFPQGGYTFSMYSDLSDGVIPVPAFEVTPQDDGQEVLVDIPLDWVKTQFNVPVRASDGITPVPGASISMVSPRWADIAFMSELPDENSAASGFFWGPPTLQNPQFKVRYSYLNKNNQLVDLEADLPPVQPGDTLNSPVNLDLTVARCRLTETDGAPLDNFQTLYPRVWELWMPNNLPQVKLGNLRHSVLFGWPTAVAPEDAVTLTLYEPQSGMGRTVSVQVPPLGQAADYVEALPANAWLVSATLNGAIPQENKFLHLAISKDSSGLVRPDLATWVKDPMGLWSQAINGSHLQIKSDLVLGGMEFGDPLNPQKIRVPLGAKAWLITGFVPAIGKSAGEETKEKTRGTYITFTAPFGCGTLPDPVNGEINLTLNAENWPNWGPVTFQVDTPESSGGTQMPENTTLLAYPAGAPHGWEFQKDETKREGNAVYTLPLDQMVAVQTWPRATGLEFYFGSTIITPNLGQMPFLITTVKKGPLAPIIVVPTVRKNPAEKEMN